MPKGVLRQLILRKAWLIRKVSKAITTQRLNYSEAELNFLDGLLEILKRNSSDVFNKIISFYYQNEYLIRVPNQ